jgi:hypothetical protein
VRFMFSSPLPSPVSRTSRMWTEDEDEAMDVVRKSRKTRKWRERFDPRDVQRLCGEALAELS